MWGYGERAHMPAVLTDLSETLAATVAAAGDSAVRVEARRRMPASGVVWSGDGLVVTTHHGVESDENIHVGLPDGRRVPASLVGRDPTTDLALLRVQAGDITAPSWTEADQLKVGHLVLALGRPGKSVRATLGIVSALGDSWRTPAGGLVDRYLQTDVVMYPGFSGGPLVDASGRVLGVNTSMVLRGTSLAIPISTVRGVVETLSQHGRVRRGFLGIGSQPVRLPAALAQQLGQETGLLISSVEQGGPAEKGGLVLGDTLVGMEGEPVRNLDDLFAFLGGDRIGAVVSARVVRGGALQEQSVTVGERPAGG